MIKGEYIDFIRNSLPQVDKTDRFHREQVARAIDVAVSQVFQDAWNNNPVKKAMERYTVTVSKTPTSDATTGRYFINLGVDVVDLPRKTGGVFDVLTSSTTTTKFVPVSVLEGNQLYGSESSLPGNVVGYSWDGARTVEFWDMSAAEASAGVVVRVIQKFLSYGLTDYIPLPYGQEAVVTQMVREFLGATPPKDLVNDNADIRNG